MKTVLALAAAFLAAFSVAASAQFSGFLQSSVGISAPPAGVTVVQKATPGQNVSSGTSWTTSFGSNTGTTKHGVVVGLFFCLDSSCASSASDPFIGGTVTVGSNSCAEMPGSYQDVSVGANVFATTVFVCPNLTSAATLVSAATNGTTIWYLAVFATELSCPTSGCVADGTIGNFGSTATNTFVNMETSGTTSVANDFIYSIAATQNGQTLTASDTPLSTISGGISDEYLISGASGTFPIAQWSSTVTIIAGSIAAVKP